MSRGKVWAFLFGMVSIAALPAQVITTVAGGDWVFPTVALSAVNAPLGRISGVAIDAQKNVYIADRDNCMVMKIDTHQVITAYAGTGKSGYTGNGGQALSATFSCPGPAGLALDSAGNLYIADVGNHVVRMVTPGGIISTIMGTGTAGAPPPPGVGFSRLDTPTGVAVDSQYLYVVDRVNKLILRRSVNGFVEPWVGGGSSTQDGASRSNAALEVPIAVFVDSAGNLLFIDNQRLRQVAASGSVTTIAGNGTSTDSNGDKGPALGATLAHPCGVVTDGNGNIFITESDGYRIRQITNGTITTLGGGSGTVTTTSIISYPAGIAVDSSGIVYSADAVNFHLVQTLATGARNAQYAGNGNYRFNGDGPAVSTTFNTPQAVAVDGKGKIYFADTLNNRVRYFTRNGSVTTVAGTNVAGYNGDNQSAFNATLNQPTAIAFDKQGNLYIADSLNHRIRVVNAISGLISTFANISSADQLTAPTGLAVDAAGNVYVADAGKHQVLMIKAVDGGVSAYAGIGVPDNYGDQGPARLAALNSPGGLAIDASGTLYIADTLNHVVRKVTTDGKIDVVAGTYALGTGGDGTPATSAPLFYPRGLTLDSAGNLYIADTGASTVRVVLTDKTIKTVAGNANLAGSYGDGGPAIFAGLQNPYGVAVDSSGLAYILDTGNNRIRAVLATPPTYQVQPASLTFSVVAGGPKSDPQTISISSTDVPGLVFRVSSDVPWLSSSLPSQADSSMPANGQITVDPSSLTVSAGQSQTYTGHITVSAPAAVPPQTSIPVTVNVQAQATAPFLALSVDSVNLRGIESGPDITFPLKVSNLGAGTLSFTTSIKTSAGGSWLSVSPSNGSVTLASPTTLAITASIGATKAGTYQGTITLTGNFQGGGSRTIPVTLSITPPNAIILISQKGLSFNTAAGGGIPLSQNFGILNVGQGVMNWTAKVNTLSGGNWLQISANSGTVTKPYVDVSFVDVNVNPSNLTAGTYYGTIAVDALAINRPQSLMVILTVQPAGTPLGMEVRPTGLIFTGQQNVSPSPQDVTIGSSQADSFRTSAIGRTFTFTPSTGNLIKNQPTDLRVYPDFTNLPAGTYDFGAITLQTTSDGTLRTVNVLTVVAPASTGLRPESRAGEPSAGCSSNQLGVVFRLPQQSGPSTFQAYVGQPLDIEVQVTDRCGGLIGPGLAANNAQVYAVFSNGDTNATLTHTGNGVWKGTWRPVHPSATPVTINVLAITYVPSAAGGTGMSGSLSTSASNTPIVTSDGVVQAASIVAGVPIAPGSLVTIYGSNLADATMSPANSGTLPSQLGGTQVLMGDTLLPLLFTSTGQVNVQVPYNVPVDTQFQLSVQRGNALSVPEQLAVAQAEPGIFTPDGTGIGQGHIYKSDQVTLAKSGSPAAIGETILVYCSGLGAVSPAVLAGTSVPSDVAHPTVNPVTLLIGGKQANVLYAGLTSGFVGLYQINAVVPAGILTGDTVPVVIQVAGQSSRTTPPVTMAVQ